MFLCVTIVGLPFFCVLELAYVDFVFIKRIILFVYLSVLGKRRFAALPFVYFGVLVSLTFIVLCAYLLPSI